MGYHEEAIWRLAFINNGEYSNFYKPTGDFSDTGYPVYLAILYKIFGVHILLIRVIKSIISTYTCLLIYKLAKRNFGNKQVDWQHYSYAMPKSNLLFRFAFKRN